MGKLIIRPAIVTKTPGTEQFEVDGKYRVYPNANIGAIVWCIFSKTPWWRRGKDVWLFTSGTREDCVLKLIELNAAIKDNRRQNRKHKSIMVALMGFALCTQAQSHKALPDKPNTITVQSINQTGGITTGNLSVLPQTASQEWARYVQDRYIIGYSKDLHIAWKWNVGSDTLFIDTTYIHHIQFLKPKK